MFEKTGVTTPIKPIEVILAVVSQKDIVLNGDKIKIAIEACPEWGIKRLFKQKVDVLMFY
jgi:hypothetical protein